MSRVSLRASSSNQGYAGIIIPRYSAQKHNVSQVDSWERRNTVRTRNARFDGDSVIASILAITFTTSESSAIFASPVEHGSDDVDKAIGLFLLRVLWECQHSYMLTVQLEQENW